MLVAVIIIIVLLILSISAAGAVVGSFAGSYSREGTPAEGGETIGGIPPGEITSETCGEMINLALSYVGNAIYEYGANCPSCSPPKFDCSSFTQHLYGTLGYGLPRTSAYQADVGEAVSPENLQPTDLVFRRGDMPHEHNDIGHVGMYIGDGKVVHAKGRNFGVVVEPVSVFTQNSTYRGARHIIDCK